MITRILAVPLVTLALVASPIASAQQYIYPAKGQSAQQQQKDEGECHGWAVTQSGYDPAKPAAAPAPVQTGPNGSRVRGAAVGATVAAITDNDVGDAAKAGVVVGGMSKRSSQRQAARNQQQQVEQQQANGQAGYQSARMACLEGRGYTVK